MSPPCDSTISLNLSSALPEFIIFVTCFCASLNSMPFVRLIIFAARLMQSGVSLGMFSPFNTFIASCTSKLFPTAYPSGDVISVIKAVTFLPHLFPMLTISFASFDASSRFFIKAPSPHFTSSTMFFAPAASFLLIIDDAISGIQSTVAVTSLSA